MAIKKRHILSAVLVAVLLLSVVSSAALGQEGRLDIAKGTYSYADWLGEKWRNVEACASWTGPKRASIDDPDDSAWVCQSCTLGWSYDDPRHYWFTTYTPGSLNHAITVRARSTPSGVRFSDPAGFANTQAGEPAEDMLAYALDTLWNFAMSFLHLPFPSPWSLLGYGEDSEEITITRDSDWRGGKFKYNTCPDLQGADWFWMLLKPVSTGTFYAEICPSGEAGHYYSSFWGVPVFVKQHDVYLYMLFHFRVYMRD
jgi:hypothetical protein